jgi:hypothetical protein
MTDVMVMREKSIGQAVVRITIFFSLISTAQIYLKQNGGRVYVNFCTRSMRCKEPSILQGSLHICEVSKCQSVGSIFELTLRHHGGCQGDTAQTLAQWWHPVASSKALDVLHRVIHSALHRCTPMVIKIASNFPAPFCIVNFVVVHNSS